MSRGNRYFTWDGYYRGPGAGIGFVLLLGAVLYEVAHPGTIDGLLKSLRPQLPDLPTPTVTPPIPPGDVPTP